MVNYLFTTSLLFVYSFNAKAQCPVNIDFETGTFDGWTCYIGGVSAQGDQNVFTLQNAGGPVRERQTMYSLATSTGETDPFGGFPVNCPNGSGHSIRLGNSTGGGEAEGISYEFTIPAGQNVYSLIYHYAVVFQDPNHEEYQQPRMVTEITNVSDNTLISCSSFTFFPFGSLLPGFFESPDHSTDTPVWCKNWSAVSINLDNMAGKTIRLFFKTGDCTFRKHFGYAYIDVNSECSSEFVGAAYCPDDTAVNVIAPYGYQAYNWYNSDFSQILGTQQTLRFSPLPIAGTTIAVEVIPFDGYGCLDTLYAKLLDTLTVKSNAGPDMLACNLTAVQLGANPKTGLVYSWSPTNGLNSPTIANPFSNPPATTQYVLKTNHDGGGCISTDTVIVKTSIIDNLLTMEGKPAFCEGYGDSAVLHVNPANQIQWYRDNQLITGATQTPYHVTRTGSYYAILSNSDGCTISSGSRNIVIDQARPGIRYPIEYALIDLPLTLHAREFGQTVIWNPDLLLDVNDSYTPVFKGEGEQLYDITITTASGCITVDTQLVRTVKSVQLYVPTAFTPNRDGLNDYLRPVLMGVKELTYFKIFNRWGEIIFESKNALPGWDGIFKGTKLGTQVVVWIAEGIGVDGKTYTRKGTSTLIR